MCWGTEQTVNQNQVSLFEDAQRSAPALMPLLAGIEWSGVAKCWSSPSQRDEGLQDPLTHPFPAPSLQAQQWWSPRAWWRGRACANLLCVLPSQRDLGWDLTPALSSAWDKGSLFLPELIAVSPAGRLSN